ncbi:MAG: plastocyanin/azurin family copper-binding protein [Acidobacteriota bacterium]
MKRVVLSGVFCLLVGPAGLLAQPGHMGHLIDKNLIFPDVVVGGGVNTQIIIMNPQPGLDVTGTLFFFNQDGSPLQVLNNGQPTNQIPITVAAQGADFVQVTGVDPDAEDPTVGWALLEVSGPGQGQDDPRTRLFGSVTFTTTQGTTTTGVVGVVAGRYELGAQRTVALPVIVQGTAVNTGIALVNAGPDPMTLTFQLKDEEGTVVQGGATITPPISPLAPGRQVALFLNQLFQGFGFNDNDFRGTLLIMTQQEGLVVTGLLTNNALLTSIPIVLVRPPGGGQAQTHTVTNSGFTFSPAEITITAGDSVQWQLATIHNVVEVAEQTWNANGNTAKEGGFSTGFGGGTVKLDTPGTHFYVCAPHASQGMKGRIIVNAPQ